MKDDKKAIFKNEKLKKQKMACGLGRKTTKFFSGMYNGMRYYFINNSKRFLALFVTVIFFMLTCSFALPSSIDLESEDSFSLSEEIEVEDQELMMQIARINESFETLEFYEKNQYSEIDVEEEIFSLDDIIESANQSGVQAELDGEDSLDPDSWNLILINKQHPVPAGYEVELATIKDSMQCDARILPHLLDLLQAAKTESGITLVVASPYRDYERQKYLFEQKLASFLSEGFSYFEAYHFSSQTVTVPGASEHQIGIAVDLLSSTYMSMNTGFANDRGGIWLAENAHRFGFILRYQLGKEYITGIQFEPWHFRYVGITAATMMYEQGLTLEEFIEGL